MSFLLKKWHPNEWIKLLIIIITKPNPAIYPPILASGSDMNAKTINIKTPIHSIQWHNAIKNQKESLISRVASYSLDILKKGQAIALYHIGSLYTFITTSNTHYKQIGYNSTRNIMHYPIYEYNHIFPLNGAPYPAYSGCGDHQRREVSFNSKETKQPHIQRNSFRPKLLSSSRNISIRNNLLFNRVLAWQLTMSTVKN